MRSGKKVRPRDLPERILLVTRSRVPSAPKSIEIQLDRPLKESILAIVRGALDAEAGNRMRAAERLGISVRTIQRYLPELP
jgi:transcriptional regulator with PAS, ATPase and Fis domain